MDGFVELPQMIVDSTVEGAEVEVVGISVDVVKSLPLKLSEREEAQVEGEDRNFAGVELVLIRI